MADEENKEKETEEGEAAEGEGGEGGEGKKKGGKKKKIIILGVVVVLLAALGGGGFFAYKKGLLNKFLKKESSEEAGGEGASEGGEASEGAAAGGEGGVVGQSVYYDMEEIIVNLNVGSARPSFLKMTVSLELPGELQIPRVEQKMPRIRDSFQVYLRELRQDDLQGSAGLYRLREELLLRINKIVYPAKVSDILFKEILVQ